MQTAPRRTLMSPSAAHAFAVELRTVPWVVLMATKLSQNRGASLAYWRARRRVSHRERARDPEAAPFADHGPASDAVSARAYALAVEGREDVAAVAELRALGREDGGALREAETMARVGGRHRESVVEDRRYRLLVAALRGGDIQPPDPADLARCKVVAEFKPLARDLSWKRLTELQPELVSLEAAVRAGSYVRPKGHSRRALGAREARRRAREDARRWYAMTEQIAELLGPTSNSADPLLSSRTARDAAAAYLQDLGEGS